VPLGRVGQRDKERAPGAAVDRSGAMSDAGRVLDEHYVSAAEASLLAGCDLDFDLTVEKDNELAPGCAMPIQVVARIILPKDQTGHRMWFGQTADLACVGELDLRRFELRPSIG
jgi:hypothetical protein